MPFFPGKRDNSKEDVKTQTPCASFCSLWQSIVPFLACPARFRERAPLHAAPPPRLYLHFFLIQLRATNYPFLPLHHSARSVKKCPSARLLHHKKMRSQKICFILFEAARGGNKLRGERTTQRCQPSPESHLPETGSAGASHEKTPRNAVWKIKIDRRTYTPLATLEGERGGSDTKAWKAVYFYKRAARGGGASEEAVSNSSR